LICGLFGTAEVVETKNQQRKNEVMDTRADTAKAKQILNWTPKVTIDEGLRRLKKQAEHDYTMEL
jgi:nucleoside-diphosphate-sugar epimerase